MVTAQLVPRTEGGDLRPAHDGAVVVHEFGEHANRRQASETAKIDAGFGVA